MVLSKKTSGNTDSSGPDECNYYFATLLIDTTLCVLLSVNILLKIEIILKNNGLEIFKSGIYYKTSSIKRIEILHA